MCLRFAKPGGVGLEAGVALELLPPHPLAKTHINETKVAAAIALLSFICVQLFAAIRCKSEPAGNIAGRARRYYQTGEIPLARRPHFLEFAY
jgi:hypothetical protein